MKVRTEQKFSPYSILIESSEEHETLRALLNYIIGIMASEDVIYKFSDKLLRAMPGWYQNGSNL